MALKKYSIALGHQNSQVCTSLTLHMVTRTHMFAPLLHCTWSPELTCLHLSYTAHGHQNSHVCTSLTLHLVTRTHKFAPLLHCTGSPELTSLHLSYTAHGHQNSQVCTSLTLHMPHPLQLLNWLILTVSAKQFKPRSSSLHNFIRPPATSSLLGQIFPSAPCSQKSSVHFYLLGWET